MRLPSIGFGAALLTATAVSVADVAPPPDYVESCTVAKQQQPGQECTECGTYYAEHDKCEKTLGTQGYGRKCRTRGASVWNEVWCRPAQGARPDPDPHPSDPNYAKPPPGPAAIATDPAKPVAADPAPQPSPVPPRSGCGSCSVGRQQFGIAALIASAMAGLLLLGRRRF